MHIPDGFLDTKVIVATTALSAAGLAAAWKRVHTEVPPQRIPLLGVAAAFVFAAQMLNFPVAGGTSGHLIGGVLVAVLLGPGAASIVIATVLAVQCFLFADGGLLALGANIFNMALLGVISGYAVFRLLAALLPGSWGKMIAVAVAAWASVMLGAICCAGELAWSGIVSWNVVFPAMAGVHALIGAGEATITCMVLAAITVARPDLVQPVPATPARGSVWPMTVFGLVAAAGLVLFVSPFASRWPDGLEKAASTLGFSQHATQYTVATQVLPDYTVPGIASGAGTVVAGTLGVGLVFGLALLLARMVRTR
jgi:cobalt/nickel transport system permease protein